ncbi:MAG: hypothetical protein QM679_06485, partial [Patulibacter sp.]
PQATPCRETWIASASIPLRYMHSPVETIDLRDVEAAAALVAAFARRVPADLDLRRSALR